MSGASPAKRPSSARRLSRTYLVAFGLLALLALARSKFEISLTRSLASDGERIHLIAQQRVLAERMTTLAYALAAVTASDGARAEDRETMRATRDAWRRLHQRTNPGTADSELSPLRLSTRAALDSLVPQRDRIDSIAARVLLASRDSLFRGGGRALADSLNALTLPYAASSERIGDVLSMHQRSDMQRLQRLTYVFFVLLCTFLVLLHTFVFRPALRSLAALMRSQAVDNERLAEQAAQLLSSTEERSRSHRELEAQHDVLRQQAEEMFTQQSLLQQQREALMQRTRDLTRLSAIMDATPDPVVVYTTDGRLEYANSAAQTLLQHTSGLGWRGAYRIFAAWSARQLRDVVIPFVVEHGVWQGESALRGADGVERPVLQTVLAHYDATGAVVTISSITHDISEQKHMQRELAEREARNRAIVESLAEGVVVQNADGQIVAWNESAERILGLSADQLLGRTSMDPTWSVIDEKEEVLVGDAHPIVRARVSGQNIDGEIMGVHRGDGSLVWLSVNARPMYRVGDDDRAGAVATFTDVTQQRLTARELETLSVVAQQSDYAVVTTDAQATITWVNAAWERLTGFTAEEAIGRAPAHLSEGPQTDTETVARRRELMKSGQSFNGELLHYHKDGSPYWVELTVTPLLDACGEITGWVGLSRDITMRRASERERHQLAAALAVTADGIAITGVGGTLEFVNHAFARMHSARPSELIAASWNSLYEPTEANRLVKEAIPEVTSLGFWQGEAIGRRADGSVYPQELSLTLLPQGGLVAVARDATERKAAQEQLRDLAIRDELTGLLNRRGFMSQTEHLLDLAARQCTTCALFYADLDGFKSINDEYGHAFGDAALMEVASILSSVMRSTDLTARLGGDEFTILAYDLDLTAIPELLRRIHERIDHSNLTRANDAARDWILGISLGVATFDPSAPLGVEALLRAADANQYEEKARRKAMNEVRASTAFGR